MPSMTTIFIISFFVAILLIALASSPGKKKHPTAAPQSGDPYGSLPQDELAQARRIDSRLSADVWHRVRAQIEALIKLRKDILTSDESVKQLLSHTTFRDLSENEDPAGQAPVAVAALMGTDIRDIFDRMGHSIQESSPEQMCVTIMMAAGLGIVQEPPKRSDLAGYYTVLNSNVQHIVDNDFNLSTNQDGETILMAAMLASFDQALADRYLAIIYRFFTLVAKQDGKVSEKEQEGLKFIASHMQSKQEGEQKNSPQAAPPDPLKELQRLIGLGSVKAEVQSLVNFIKIQQQRQQQGLKTTQVSYHCVFTGNPGTGKTTVARLLAGIYRDLGVIKKGQLVETDRSSLVAEYVGQTAVKTNKVIDSALDGILFIDEAYSLVEGGDNDFGREAISTLLKRMEDDRDRLVVILAGYTAEMQRFIDSNPGLQSRFNHYIEFPDYTAAELEQIFQFNLQKNQYVMTPETTTLLREILADAVAHKDQRFGNARFVRNLFESTIRCQADRLAALPQVTSSVLTTILPQDLQRAQQ